MNTAMRFKLFVMMVLEFFIWGAWLPLIYGYLPSLGFGKLEQGLILSAFPFAAIVGMFFSNQFADRSFAAEKFLAVSHLIGGLAILCLAYTKDFGLFFALMLIHCLLYVPTLAICNSIAFANMKDAQKEFGLIRMGGSIGWILAAWPFVFILVDWDKVAKADTHGIVNWLGTVLGSGLKGEALQEGTRSTFLVAGIVSLILSAYSLFVLPHTPPKKAEKTENKFAWVESLKLLKHPFILILWIITFVDAFILYCYFNWTGSFLQTPEVGISGNWVMPVMSIGQVSEILTMVILGVTLKKLGWRTTMVIGILGHALRFAVFAFFPEMTTLIVLVNVLHGVCYAFFFATVYIFVEEYFPKDVRASAQGLFNVMIFGLGSLVANSVCPMLTGMFTVDKVVNYKGMFMVPTALSLLAAIVLALFFRPPVKQAPAPAA
jgi:nucleoside transporter